MERERRVDLVMEYKALVYNLVLIMLEMTFTKINPAFNYKL